MLHLVETGWNRLRARWNAALGLSPERTAGGAELSDRIRARYDTARKHPRHPTNEWLREHGVRDDWMDAWRAVDRW
jgi:hypothetical protein